MAHTYAERQIETGDEPEYDPALAVGYEDTVEALIYAYRLLDGEPFVIQPDGDAKELMRDFKNSTVHKDGRYSDVEPFVSRWAENAWRIAVVLHCAHHGAEAHKHSLSGDTAARAIDVQKWFAREQLRLLTVGRMKKREEQKERVLNLITKKFAADRKYITERTIQQNANMDAATVRGIVAELLQGEQIERIVQKPVSGPEFFAYGPK
jgi:hypothetical protein